MIPDSPQHTYKTMCGRPCLCGWRSWPPGSPGIRLSHLSLSGTTYRPWIQSWCSHTDGAALQQRHLAHLLSFSSLIATPCWHHLSVSCGPSLPSAVTSITTPQSSDPLESEHADVMLRYFDKLLSFIDTPRSLSTASLLVSSCVRTGQSLHAKTLGVCVTY